MKSQKARLHLVQCMQKALHIYKPIQSKVLIECTCLPQVVTAMGLSVESHACALGRLEAGVTYTAVASNFGVRESTISCLHQPDNTTSGPSDTLHTYG